MYYVVNYKGEVLAEASTRAEAIAKMELMYTPAECEADEIEVIKDDNRSEIN